MHINVNNIYEHKSISGFYLLKANEIKTARNNNQYLTGTLVDKTGSIDFKLWNYTGDIFPTGKAVYVDGNVTEYKQIYNLILNDIRKTTDNDNFDMSELVPAAPITVSDYKRKLEILCQNIKDPDYNRLVTWFKLHYLDIILNAPAAKSIHHAFINGLLMHTVNIMTMANALTEIYPFINKSLLLTAAFLHDIGKPLSEFEINDIGLVDNYTQEGTLLGHIVAGSYIVKDACKKNKIPEDKTLALLHCILSHHGLPEYGAAVKPMTPEADMLAKLDQMDAVMEIFRNTMENMSSGEISNPISFLEGRRIYKL